MPLKNCQPVSRVWEVGAFSSTLLQTPFTLGSGVVWSGQNQSDFVTYHMDLQKRITNYLTKSKKNEKDPRQPQVTIYDIKPILLEPEQASDYYFGLLGRYVPFFPLKKCVHKITIPKNQSVESVILLTDKLFPNNSGKTFARLPASFTVPQSDAILQYAWIRLLAWHVKGYMSKKFRKRNKARLREPNFNATILSVLPSGHLDAVVGVIDICASRHIQGIDDVSGLLQESYCPD
ncbi:hypothetical protein DSO57_1020105 [Entomophthora muscae]|uniref:Uncharacterized protein n=1 Tax=Entomophthora muscae TaxID=34485 RepID=A0ACC2U299_9FUNG|nr:hypothetical protein DSO57_1020105 [Entomophthora muscae]